MTETSPLGTVQRLQPKHTIYQKTKNEHHCQTRYCFSRCGNKNMTDEGTLAPTDGEKAWELQIKGHGLSIPTLKPKPG
jgi:fatty-acyl-CoA synthase